MGDTSGFMGQMLPVSSFMRNTSGFMGDISSFQFYRRHFRSHERYFRLYVSYFRFRVGHFQFYGRYLRFYGCTVRVERLSPSPLTQLRVLSRGGPQFLRTQYPQPEASRREECVCVCTSVDHLVRVELAA